MLPTDRKGGYHDEGKDKLMHAVRHTYIYVLVSYMYIYEAACLQLMSQRIVAVVGKRL